MARRAVTAAAAGYLLWTAVEYGTHRWTMHGRGRSNPLAREHLDHHGHPDDTYRLGLDAGLLWRVAGFAAVAGPIAVVLDPAVGAAAGAGFTAGYVGYTELHHRIHHAPPRGQVARAVYRRHLRHHASARTGYGVTTALWDVVARTRSPDRGPVRLPRRFLPAWALDARGAVHPDHRRDYELLNDRGGPAGA